MLKNVMHMQMENLLNKLHFIKVTRNIEMCFKFGLLVEKTWNIYFHICATWLHVALKINGLFEASGHASKI